MKIIFGSDLHLEFDKETGKMDLVEQAKSHDPDVIILAGDISVGAGNVCNFAGMLQRETGAHVFIVSGNHEYYGGVYQHVNERYEDILKSDPNIDFLLNKKVTLDGVDFLGTTLWTNLRVRAGGHEWMNYEYIRRELPRHMNDFKRIKVVRKNGEIKNLTTDYWLGFNKVAFEFLDNELRNKKRPQVVITHHAPIPQMDTYGGVWAAAYSSDYSHFLCTNWNPEYWISGHTHAREEIEVHQTKCMSNCRGYPGHEAQADTFEWKVITL